VSYDVSVLRGAGVKHNNKILFKGRQFTAEIILRAVRWYLQFPINYRDLERMLADRSVHVDHTTLVRWIRAYARSSTGASVRMYA
jgi:transposase, IS6 family